MFFEMAIEQIRPLKKTALLFAMFTVSNSKQ